MEEKPDKEKQKSSTIAMLVFLGVIIAVIVIIFWSRFTPEPIPMTIDERLKYINDNDIDNEFEYVYNGFSFLFTDGLWFSKIQLKDKAYTLPLHYGPRELEDVPAVGDFDLWTTWVAQKVGFTYITFDPGENLSHVALANSELSVNLFNALEIEAKIACTTNEDEACQDIPTITCNSTTAPVIYLVQREETGVKQADNCIIVQGTGFELVKALEKFLYVWYGVM